MLFILTRLSYIAEARDVLDRAEKVIFLLGLICDWRVPGEKEIQKGLGDLEG